MDRSDAEVKPFRKMHLHFDSQLQPVKKERAGGGDETGNRRGRGLFEHISWPGMYLVAANERLINHKVEQFSFMLGIMKKKNKRDTA